MGRITVLCGGVGAARFLAGLVRVVDPGEVTAIVNVGDDAEFHGLHVSPDIDTVLYTLAGIVNEQQGWGIAGDSWRVQDSLVRLGREAWFRLGDIDLSTHIQRTALLREGLPLSAVTTRLANALGVHVRILPASDERQSTLVRADQGWLEFQEYFVHRGQRDTVREVRFDGSRTPAPGVIDAITGASVVLIAPSNPIVSIGPILALDGVRDALIASTATVVAVSPIIGGEAVKGPAAAMLASLGHEVSAVGVARMYADFVDVMVIDERDAELAPEVDASGPHAVIAPTLMTDAAARERLARVAVEAATSDVGV